ncbi:hypothetical protein [Aquisalimonas sp.]|uniref:hypothetical protein n=1 Tax=Aquisalimonas sp. TaxID=1872621 RepID=UPI0025BED9BA|nr:hypothetical protein [Aquisalimonas sp.]
MTRDVDAQYAHAESGHGTGGFGQDKADGLYHGRRPVLDVFARDTVKVDHAGDAAETPAPSVLSRKYVAKIGVEPDGSWQGAPTRRSGDYGEEAQRRQGPSGPRQS